MPGAEATCPPAGGRRRSPNASLLRSSRSPGYRPCTPGAFRRRRPASTTRSSSRPALSLSAYFPSAPSATSMKWTVQTLPASVDDRLTPMTCPPSNLIMPSGRSSGHFRSAVARVFSPSGVWILIVPLLRSRPTLPPVAFSRVSSIRFVTIDFSSDFALQPVPARRPRTASPHTAIKPVFLNTMSSFLSRGYCRLNRTKIRPAAIAEPVRRQDGRLLRRRGNRFRAGVRSARPLSSSRPRLRAGRDRRSSRGRGISSNSPRLRPYSLLFQRSFRANRSSRHRRRRIEA